MKFRIVCPTDVGPTFYEQENLASIAELLMSWSRRGLDCEGGSIWKKTRNRWEPLTKWGMK